MVICWNRFFCSMHCFMISICDAESQLNDSTNERYHLLIHHKELEQSKNIWPWKAAAIKVTTKYKIQYQILLSLRKKKNHKSDIYQEYFQIKLSILPMNHQCEDSFVKHTFVDDGGIHLVTNRFDRNSYCTVSGGNFVYSFSFLRSWSI